MGNQKLFDWCRDICPTREVSKEDFSSKTYTKNKFSHFFRILSRINTVFFLIRKKKIPGKQDYYELNFRKTKISLNFEQLPMGQMSQWIDVSFETCPLNECFFTISHEQFDCFMLLFSSCQKIFMFF